MTAVRLRELRIRRDGAEWIVGRAETGRFISIPPSGMRVIELLREGASPAEAERRIRGESGERVDVQDFVTAMVEMGFVAEIDERPVAAPPPAPVTLPRLRPGHVSWLLSPRLHAAVAALILLGAGLALARPSLLPGPSAVAWNPLGSVSLLTQAMIAWSCVCLHELAHLCTARAAGVPGRIRLSTRLQFLTAQTDVTGVWAVERRDRLTVYLSGMALDAVIASCALVTLALTHPDGGPHRLVSVVLLNQVVSLGFQLMIFMRTDLYFVFQDLSGCRNLYADGRAYLGYLLGHPLRRPAVNPLAALPRREAVTVRIYTVVLLTGTVACLTVAVVVMIPALLTLLGPALDTLISGGDLVATADAVVVVTVVGGFQLLWAWTRWRERPVRRRRSGRSGSAGGAGPAG